MGPLIPIIIGQLISLTGSSIQSMAIPLYILNTTGSGLMVSISQMITIIVTVVFSPLAGVLGDRYNKKRLLIGSDIISGAVVTGLFMLFALGIKGLAFIFLCQALCAASECMLISSLFAIIPDIVPGGKITRANAVRSIGTSVALFVGPMIGGFVYTMFGMKYVFLINALSFMLSAALAGTITYRRRTIRSAPGFSFASFKRDLREIAAYLTENVGIRKLAFFAIMLNLLSAPILFVIIPFLINQVFKMSSQQYGLIQGFYMVGFFVGGLALSIIKFKNTKAMVKPALLVMAAATLGLSLMSLPPAAKAFGSVVAITALVVMIGAGDCISGTIVQSEIQSSARPDIISRMGGMLNMFFQASIPLGLLLVGALIDHVPVYAVFIPVAVLLALFVAIFSGRLFKTGEEPGNNISVPE